MATLLETRDNGVAVLTMNRPEQRNPMDEALAYDLLHTLRRLATDQDIGCVLLTGAGQAFSAGGDLAAMAAAAQTDRIVADQAAALREMMECARLLHEMPKPTIAALPGAAAGAGLALAMACDLRISTGGAKLVTAFARVALSGDFGGSYFMTRLAGTAKARELYFLGDTISAAEAERIGLINRIVEDDSLMETAITIAQTLAAGPRTALAYMKQNLNLAEQGRLDLSLDQEALLHTLTLMTADHCEAVTSLIEKRPAQFKRHIAN